MEELNLLSIDNVVPDLGVTQKALGQKGYCIHFTEEKLEAQRDCEVYQSDIAGDWRS